MYILGISCFFHDSSACLLKDGIVVAAALEERFTRKKHDNSFPINAIRFCLEKENITINDIDYIGFYEKPLLKAERILYQHLQEFPKSYKAFIFSLPSLINEKLRLPSIIKKKLRYKGDILFINHHLSHAASAFLPSPFQRSAILTADGVGEWTTTAYGIGNGNNIRLIKEIKFPHSIGLLYSTITAYLGFTVNNSEYKVMGLSSYGNKNKKTNPYYRKFKKIVDIKKDGSYQLDMSYFSFSYSDRMPSSKMCKFLGGPVFKKEAEITQRHKDIAAALQMITEEIMIKMLNYIHEVTRCKNIVLAGGVALNSVCNGKILDNTPFEKIWIQPDAGDGGTSMGVAFFIYNTILDHERKYILDNMYLGPKYSTEDVRYFLDKNKINYSEFNSNKELVETTAELIFKNKIISWFQEGMEWGPRALGARSILANPTNIHMKDILNFKVKHREGFRPFSPVICKDDVLRYFDCNKPISKLTDFMLMVLPVKEYFHEEIPAVTHVDGSGRLQAVEQYQNPLYYDLIKEFGKLSGIPILINTSFNIRGEPIVCTPHDAYKCMMGTGIDYLVINKFLVKRENNLQDIWSSTKDERD